jgi:hypothetical protein
MASKVDGYYVWRPKKTGSKEKSSKEPEDNIKMSEEEKNKEENEDISSDNVATLSPNVHANQFEDADDEFEFDFVDAYSDDVEEDQSELLPENVTQSAISCAFLGIGGGGGKLAKAFIDLGFTRSLLVNTTIKDQPDGVSEQNFLLIPGADGVGKDVVLGKKILTENSALVEDAVRARLGSPDWLFVLAGGGGGTGSSCHVLHDSLTRYLKTIGATGKVVYIASRPSSQELLNLTIKKNYEELLSDIANYPHIIVWLYFCFSLPSAAFTYKDRCITFSSIIRDGI